MQFKTVQGINVPEIGLGTFGLVGKQAEQVVKMALSLGYLHIDTDQVYKNEREVGSAVRQSHIDRDKLFITKK